MARDSHETTGLASIDPATQPEEWTASGTIEREVTSSVSSWPDAQPCEKAL